MFMHHSQCLDQNIHQHPSSLIGRSLPEKLQVSATRSVPQAEKEELEAVYKEYSATLNKQGREPTKSGTITVNVYWNVFTDDSETGALSDSTIAKQMQMLNDAFSGVTPSYEECDGFTFDSSSLVGTPFRFNLVETNTVKDNNAYILDFASSQFKRKELRQGTCSDLNIFTGSSFMYGGSNFPFDCDLEKNADDSVWIDYRTLPDEGEPPYNEGGTLVHEVGHWLGLYNTFEGGCRSRDYVTDTPGQARSTFGCPVAFDSCDGSGRDPIHNFMDTSDDCCRYQFTNGQTVRMILQADLYRNLTADNVTLPTITQPSCSFPDDGFNYSECVVDDKCWVGDGFCDEDEVGGYNTSNCNLDGRDCSCDFPNDGFDYSGCDVEFPCLIGDGWCNGYYYSPEYGSEECNFDGGDCRECDFPDDGFDYSNCDVTFKCFIGDTFCDSGEYDTLECNRDGGDCRFVSTLVTFFIPFIQLPFLCLWCYATYSFVLIQGCFDQLIPNGIIPSLVGNFEFPN